MLMLIIGILLLMFFGGLTMLSATYTNDVKGTAPSFLIVLLLLWWLLG